MGFLVQLVSDTLNPHNRRFPGTPNCHPGAGCRQRRATGGLSFFSPLCAGLSPGQLAFVMIVFAGPPVPARRLADAWS